MPNAVSACVFCVFDSRNFTNGCEKDTNRIDVLIEMN